MEIKKILWPTDFSKNAARALPYVASLSDKYRAEVHLVFVVEDVHEHDHFYGDAGISFLKGLQEKVVRSAEEKMDDICKKELASCPLYRKHIVRGDPASEILNAAEREKVDLIVMATHGHGEEAGTETSHFPAGRVSEKVARNSRVPVLSINP